MAEKEYSVPFKNKQNIASDDNLDGQFNNLNLNQNYQNSSDAFFKLPKIKNFPSIVGSNDYGKELKKEKSSTAKNNSTLSLHIAAYENSIESDSLLDGTKKSLNQNNLIKERDNLKQFFAVSIQNPFEFPRQQENDKSKETAHFKASQRLLNPNSTPSKKSVGRHNKKGGGGGGSGSADKRPSQSSSPNLSKESKCSSRSKKQHKEKDKEHHHKKKDGEKLKKESDKEKKQTDSVKSAIKKEKQQASNLPTEFEEVNAARRPAVSKTRQFFFEI
uniref:Uncharacterized protein n=1 Tax=Panagrolaimus davidi TaxID=227884 RepID=A0A914QUR7_9BILA